MPEQRSGRAVGKKIARAGEGAVGGYTGAHMAHADEDVTFIADPRHITELCLNQATRSDRPANPGIAIEARRIRF